LFVKAGGVCSGHWPLVLTVFSVGTHVMQTDRSVGPFAICAVTRPGSLKHSRAAEHEIQTACHINPAEFSDGELLVEGGSECRISTRYVYEHLLGSLPALIKDKRENTNKSWEFFFSGDPSCLAV
jgi:hypothetical protein